MSVGAKVEPYLSSVFERARKGRVLTIFSNEVERAVRAVQDQAESFDPMPTFVQLDWQVAPALTQELSEIEEALAVAVKSLWPNWYRSVRERFELQQFAQWELEPELSAVQASAPQVSASWYKKAQEQCRADKSPLVRGLAREEQVRQLTFALDPTRPVFCLAVHSPHASHARMHGLAKAAEWLAKQSSAPVLLFVPEGWIEQTALDAVNYDAVELHFGPAPPEPEVRVPGSVRGAPSSTAPVSASTPPAFIPEDLDEALDQLTSEPLPLEAVAPLVQPHTLLPPALSVSVSPVPGKPHPKSECEMKVYQLLQADDELRPLFRANQHIVAFGDKSYRVDLLWDEGRLVVEIDGDDHRTLKKYYDDRDRDYRLLMSGYTVLRVTNHEVLANELQVLTKMRHVARACLTQGSKLAVKKTRASKKKARRV